MTEQEIQTKVEYVFSNSFNHTTHAYIDITGDLVAGTLLSQIMYWFAPSKNKTQKTRIFKDGYYWIAKRREDWWDEIRITPKQFDTAIKKLGNGGKDKNGLNLVETKLYKFNGIPTMHIRPIYDNINPLISQYKENIRKEIGESELFKEESFISTNGENGISPKGKMEIDQTVKSLTENTNRDYNTENTYNDFPKENKYNNAFSREKKKESYAFSDSETKPNKGLDMKYVRNIAEQYMESECVEDSKTKTEEFVNIVSYFCEQYKLRLGKPHKFLKPETIEKLVRKYIEPTELLATMEKDEIIESYRMMIDKFFDTEYNKRGGFGGEIDKTLCYFWNDTIIENLFYRTCYGGIDEKEDDG